LRKDAVPPTAPVRLVDINSASHKELKTLPGIGDAEADKIIANRPYLTKTELVTKQVLPTGPFLSLRNRVIAMQPIKPKGKS
jgi:competence protein ComEA